MFRRLEPTRAAAVTISVAGAPLVARLGDTVAAALLADGRMPAGRHVDGGPRLPFCLCGTCQQCWLVIDDMAEVPACTTLVREGMRVEFPPDDDAEDAPEAST